MLTDGHFFPFYWPVGWYEEWPLSGNTDKRRWTQLYSRKMGCSGREGQPPGSSDIVVRLTPEGERGSGRTPAGLATTGGGRPWISLDPKCPGLSGPGSHSTTDAGRRERPVSDNGGDVADGGTARLPISTLEMGDPMRGMRPAGAGRSSPPKPVVDLSDVGEKAVGWPLSVEAPEFSPTLGPWTRGTAGSVALSMHCRDYRPSRFCRIISSGGGWDEVLGCC